MCFFGAVRISPKILGLNVGMFGTIFGQSRIMLRVGFVPGLMSSSFVVCFGVWGCFLPKLEMEKWTEPGLVKEVLRLYDALLN